MALTTEEVQVETTTRPHSTPIQTAIVQDIGNQQVLARERRTGNPRPAGGNVNRCGCHRKWQGGLLKDLDFPYDATLLLLGIHPKEPKTRTETGNDIPVFPAEIPTQRLKARTKCARYIPWKRTQPLKGRTFSHGLRPEPGRHYDW